ncbi:capsule assembly Wzi family protein [Ekhidna sp.]|uniref:capsule assembly Wzi family protein n=1 Tax=Ekhidna sp. TaxID=2608089 RepID=UPI003B5B7ACE
MTIRRNKGIISLCVFFVMSGFGSSAQVLDPNDMLLDYYKILELKNPQIQERINIHPSIVHSYENDSLEWNPWQDYLISSKNGEAFQMLPLRTKASFNSGYSRSYNDGAVWQGRGLTMQAQAGFTGRNGHLRYTFMPIVYWSQNKSFQLAENLNSDVNPFNYQFQVRGFADYVQRYGNDSFVGFHPGQSEVRVVFNWFTIGIATQNVVFGPAQRNPILLGNSGGMMPHIDLGTDRPVKTLIGKIEAKMYWGRMTESSYNNPVSDNPNQYFAALSVGYSPKWIKGLYFGANRIFYKRWQDFSASDYLVAIARFNPPEDRVFGNDDLDQTGSFTMRWSYPEVGFEAYMEFAKSDFGGNVLRLEPEHGRGITLGFIKLLELKGADVKLNYEHTTLGQPKNSINRFYYRYYTHGVVKNGYTHRGQLLGAGIGPGSNSDWFDAKIYFDKSMLGATMQRIRFDDDFFYENFSRKELRDYEWSWGLQYEKLSDAGRLGFEVNYASRQNRYFIEGNSKSNIYFGFSFVRPL